MQDLKKLLDDNHRELKSQGGSGGGLPEDLVGFLLTFLIKFAFTPGEVLHEAASGGHQLLPPEQGVAQVRRVYSVHCTLYLDNIK